MQVAEKEVGEVMSEKGALFWQLLHSPVTCSHFVISVVLRTYSIGTQLLFVKVHLTGSAAR